MPLTNPIIHRPSTIRGVVPCYEVGYLLSFDEGDYALAIGSGEAREILYEEVLAPGKEYTYIQDANEKQGRLHVLQEKT